MMEKLASRIAREVGLPGLADALARRIAATDLQSLLLFALRERAGRLQAADLLRQAERSPLCGPSAMDQRVLWDLDRVALSVARGFEAVELSPAQPLGL